MAFFTMKNKGFNDAVLTTSQGVRDFMLASTREQDWNDRCNEVKAANKGYPDFWYNTVIKSGGFAECKKNWDLS